MGRYRTYCKDGNDKNTEFIVKTVMVRMSLEFMMPIKSKLKGHTELVQ